MANDHGEMAGEREHILNRFPSSVRDVFMWRRKPARLRSTVICIYRLDAFGEDSPLLSGGRVSNLKGLKRFPRGGGASDCRPSNTDRPTTLSFFLAHRCARSFSASSSPLPSPAPTVTYCELLTDHTHPARKRLSLLARKFRAT